jgi:tellurite resistance protein
VLTSAHVPATQPPSADVLRAVRQLISESESRQEQELARRLSQVLRDVEGLRRVDLDRVQRALAEMQGVTDTTIIRQQQIENHLLRVGQPK